jgi:phage terminase small subunit
VQWFFVIKRKEVREMLTGKQENFARCIALDGMNQTEAYRKCYNTENMQESTIWESASRLANDCKVVARIKELKNQAVSGRIMTAIERKEKLTELILSDDPQVIMKAIDLLNKMEGEYVQKIEATVDQVSINIDLVEE